MSASSTSSEARRLQYLQAIGITSYFPRLPLPGAAPSVVHASLPAAAGFAQAMPQPDAGSAAAGDRDIGGDSRRRQDLAAVQPEPTPVSVPVDAKDLRHDTPMEKTGSNVVDSGALHFQLLLIQVDAELAVLSQIPALAPPRFQQAQQQLLGNLLRWLGKTLPATAAPRVFKWPLPGVALINNRQQAGTSLCRFLEQAAIEQAFSALLLLGEQAAECLHDHVRRHPDAPAWPWQLHATHSLDEMLALPSLKREVWQTLLPLHAALQRSGGTRH